MKKAILYLVLSASLSGIVGPTSGASGEEVSLPAFARLKHDFQLAQYDYRSRTASPNWKQRPNTPETVRFQHTSKCRSSGSIGKLTDEWMQFTEEINGDAFEGLMVPQTGWINTKYDPAKTNPSPQMLSFGGNVVEIDRVEGGCGRVRAFDSQETPPYEASWFNYKSYPQFINKFTVVTKGGQIHNVGAGVDMYIPLIRQEELWIPLERVEWFPKLPQEVCVNRTNGASLSVWSKPDAESTEAWVKNITPDSNCDSPLVVDRYRPLEGSVWGRIGQDQWIALQQYTYGMPDPVFYTDWSMETRPPVPPAQ